MSCAQRHIGGYIRGFSGKDVRILVRHKSPWEELAMRGLITPAGSKVHGDLKGRASLDAACEGAETVIPTGQA